MKLVINYLEGVDVELDGDTHTEGRMNKIYEQYLSEHSRIDISGDLQDEKNVVINADFVMSISKIREKRR